MRFSCIPSETPRADQGRAPPPVLLFSCIPSETLRADQGRAPPHGRAPPLMERERGPMRSMGGNVFHKKVGNTSIGTRSGKKFWNAFQTVVGQERVPEKTTFATNRLERVS